MPQQNIAAIVPIPPIPGTLPWQVGAACGVASLLLEWVDFFVGYDGCLNKCKEDCIDCVNSQMGIKLGIATAISVAEACGCASIPVDFIETICYQIVFAKWVREMAVVIAGANVARTNCQTKPPCFKCVPIGPPAPWEM
jgi:hypothetical protein